MKLALPLLIILLTITKIGNSQEKNKHYSFQDLAEKALLHAENEHYLKAAVELEKLNPNDSMYNSMLTSAAYYYLLAEDNEKCVEICNKGIESSQFSSPYFFYINKIAALSRLEKNEEAIQVASEAIKRYPKSYTLYFNRAISYEEIGEIKKAAKDLEESIQINPYHIKSHLRLGNLCAQQNQTAQALMCLNIYLMLSPDEEYSSKILNLANIIASRREPYTVDKKVSITQNDADFEELNLILNNKIGLNKKYKTRNKIRSSFAIQSHVLLQQLKEYEAKDGFWNEKYVPFFKWISERNFYNNMVYTTHFDSEYYKYKAIAKKNTTSVKNFVPQIYSKWSDIVARNPIANGKEVVKYSLYEELRLIGIGELKDEKLHGSWTFYTKEGATASSGSFDYGKKTGDWKIFSENGKIERELSYNNDELSGLFTTYKYGVMKHQSIYTEGKANGLITNYHPNGAIKNKMNYKDDLLNGKYETFFKNGTNKNYELNYENDIAIGVIKYYFKNGALYSTSKLEEDRKSGLEITYYNDSSIYSKLNYKNGILDGEQVYYYPNGNISKKGLSIEGENEGIWKDFYADGVKESISNYDKGTLNGKQTNFNRNGIINSEYNYKKGDFISFKTFDQKGNLLKETKKKNGKFLYTSTYANGNLRTEGLYNVKGGKTGEWKYYSRNGSLSSTENYSEEGSLDGLTSEFFSNGNISFEKNYINDSLNGPFYSYYINGTLHKQGQYVNNEVEGEWITYYKNGNPSWTGYYNNGKQFGKSISYTVDNHISEIYYYYNNQVYKEELYNDTINPPIVINPPYKANDTLVKKYLGGQIRSTGELKHNYLDGNYNYYYLDGKIQTEGHFILGKRDKNWKWYHENGKLSTTGNYKQGNKHGKWVRFFENGVKSYEKNFLLGKEQGTFKYYNEEGILTRESQYENGELNGYRKFYSEEGNLQLIRYYEHDYLIGYSYLNKEGKEIPMIKVENETAKIKTYFDNGKVARELEIVKGDFNGSYKEYYYSGQLFEIQHYENTVNQGEHIIYYPNGQIKEESTYKNNKTEGKKTYYYKDGTIKQISYYMEDNIVGEEYYFNKKGEKVKTYIYFNDGLIGQK